MERYPLVSLTNVPAYATVMAAWLGLAILLAFALSGLTAAAVSWPVAFGFAALAVMLGMAVMFVASALNLRKLRRGFARLAAGESDPDIPPVWCPVLTMATRSALEARERLQRPDTAAPTPR